MSAVELLMGQDAAGLNDEWLPDDRLLAAYRNGDETAAAELFERYYTRLVNLSRERMGGFLRQAEESSDVVQSVFLSVFSRGRDRRIDVGPNESLWPLLVTIAINKIRSRVRYWGRQRRDRRREVPVDGRDLLETGPLPEDVARLNDLVEQLLEPFGPQRRETIRCLLQDMPVPEIAGRVGTSKRTVYRTRQAAMQILEQILAMS